MIITFLCRLTSRLLGGRVCLYMCVRVCVRVCVCVCVNVCMHKLTSMAPLCRLASRLLGIGSSVDIGLAYSDMHVCMCVCVRIKAYIGVYT